MRPGDQLNHYEIIEKIGAGGMGEVYRARDTKLERDVAIKVLPDELAADPDRLARFEREAKLLASLNHPNIGAIYGIESDQGKQVLVLDRPNPAGRAVEGLTLRTGWESFVGAGPMPMRHGLTLGEMGRWFIRTLNLDVEYDVITMEGWRPDAVPGFGWPSGERAWVNPSPNAPNLSMARCYAGTVMLEGTTLSEGRGTTRPLELFGAPDLDTRRLLAAMERIAPQWMEGCRLRECWFEPTFQKHAGRLCAGIQIHVDDGHYDHHAFRPWRLLALAFKALRQINPDYELWRDFPYEYEHDRLAIDLISGSELLRLWVDDPEATPGDLEALARDTHKFESRYLDSMIGPYPEQKDLYVERSPVHFVDRSFEPFHRSLNHNDPLILIIVGFRLFHHFSEGE